MQWCAKVSNIAAMLHWSNVCAQERHIQNHYYFLGSEMEPRKSRTRQHGEDADKIRSPHAANVDAH